MRVVVSGLYEGWMFEHEDKVVSGLHLHQLLARLMAGVVYVPTPLHCGRRLMAVEYS